MNTNNAYSINVKSPKFNPVICDILYGTEIIGDTPRLAFVFSVNPKAKINNVHNNTLCFMIQNHLPSLKKLGKSPSLVFI